MEINVTNAADHDLKIPELYHAIFLIVYALVIILSIVGNVLEAVVLLVRKRLSVNIRYSLLNLALTDILMAVFYIPFTISQYVFGQWFFSTLLCDLYLFIEEMSVIVSVLTLTLIGIDRYLAVLFPFKFKWIKSKTAILIRIALIWVISIGFCTVIPFYGEVYIAYPDGHGWCSIEWPTPVWGHSYALIHFLMTFAIPLAILVFTYSSIAWKLLTHAAPGNANEVRDSRYHQKKVKIIKMLSMIVLMFGVCWAPLQIVTLMTWFDSKLLMQLSERTNKTLFAALHCFAMTNSFVNPIIYSISDNEFWKDLQYISNNLMGKEKSLHVQGKSVKPSHQTPFKNTTYKAKTRLNELLTRF